MRTPATEGVLFHSSQNPETTLSSDLISDLRQWGDRTSSLVTAYTGFQDFRCGSVAGRIRYSKVRAGFFSDEAWVGATEPISPRSDRAQFLREFFAQAADQSVEAFFMPVSETLSQESADFSHRICVGAEPIFDLKEARFVEGVVSCLRRFPNARALLNKGYQVKRLSASELTPDLKNEMNRVEVEWKAALRSETMGFLSQVDPTAFSETGHKHFYLLFAPESQRLVASLSALEIPALDAWYLTEVFRSKDAPHGSTPLLMFAAMVELARSGAKEVRLGMAPLSYEAVDARWLGELQGTGMGRLLVWLSRRDSILYGFQSAYTFKQRLRPSRWDPLFLLSSRKPSFQLLAQIVRAHFPEQSLMDVLLGAAQKRLEGSIFPSLNPIALAAIQDLPRKVPLGTAVFSSLLLLLHFFRSFSSVFESFVQSSTYIPSALKGAGWFFGPFFHNHFYHLAGDWMSFLFFGALLEWMLGHSILLGVMALGFWLTNPIADLLVRAIHAVDFGYVISESAWLNFLVEQDRGSSNAVYAFVGALSVVLTPRLGRMLLVPFIANGVYLCWVRESALSLHHLVGMAVGMVVSQLWLRGRLHRKFKSGWFFSKPNVNSPL